MVPTELTFLTGGLTYKDRKGTLIDWNLAFTADGASSGRSFHSGTPAFMSIPLLKGKPVARRDLSHDMESFFAVILWVATLDYDDLKVWKDKPMVDYFVGEVKTSARHIAATKSGWFGNQENFQEWITDHFNPDFDEVDFLTCLSKLRHILYDRDGIEINSHETDPNKERVFRACMEVMDNFVGDGKGITEINSIDSGKSAQEPEPST